MIAFLLSGIGQRIMMIVAAVAAVAAVLFGARQSGKAAARVEGLKHQLDNVAVKNDVEADVARLNAGDLDKRMRKWRRD